MIENRNRMVPSKLKYLVIGLGIVIIILLGTLVFVPSVHSPVVTVNSSSTAVDVAGSAMSPDGHVEVGAPIADDLVTSPLRLAGNVTGGGWFFEASFPVKVLDGDGKVLGQGPARAMGNWMSTGTVPFAAVIPFTAPRFEAGTIVLSKDHPSGLPQNAASFSIRIRFATTTVPTAATSTKPAPSKSSGVRGTVTLGPTCPVERIPPDPRCAPRPYQTSITVSRNIQTPEAFMTVKTDASGTFSIALDPGEYVLHPQSGSVFPRCGETLVTVAPNVFSDVTLTCDTGIR
jgi:Immunoglobulin-like domain of bacterial spore germination